MSEFYQDDKPEIDLIENELRKCLGLVVNNLTVIGKNMDNNKLLDIGGCFESLHKNLPYKDNIEVIKFMLNKKITLKPEFSDFKVISGNISIDLLK